MKTAIELETSLHQFTGTENYHKFSILAQKMVATDGVIYLAKQAGAFWLLDIIASYQHRLHRLNPAMLDFQLWTLTKHASGGCTVIGSDGNNGKLIKQKVPATDFPLDGITLYVERGCVPDGNGGVKDVWVIMLPSER